MTVLTLHNLTLEQSIECNNCYSIATKVDQLENCYCSDCLDNYSCSDCDKYDDNLLDTVDGDCVCADCASEDYIECDQCGKLSDKDDTVMTHDGDHICEHCYDNFYFTCDCCYEVYHHDYKNVTANNDDVCDECRNEYYRHCYHCDELFHIEDIYYSEDDYEYYCEDHYRPGNDSEVEDFCDNSEHVKDYSYDVRKYLGLKGTPKDKIYFGIELEIMVDTDDFSEYNAVAEDTLDRLDNFALLKSDSSIYDSSSNRNGFEIVTTATSFDLQKKHWQKFFKHKNSYLYEHENCGYHIHVSKKRLSNLQIIKMVYFLNDSVNYEFLTAIAGRKSCHYSKYKTKKLDRSSLHTGKYEPINIKSTTVEFRLYASTTNEGDFYSRLELTRAIVYYCKYSSLKSLNYNSFIDYIRENKTEYPCLVRKLDTLDY